MALDTIKIHHPDDATDYMIINAVDFDPKVHRRYSSSRGTTTQPTSNPEISTAELKASRTQELEAIYDDPDQGWRAIAALAAPLGVEKPASGWRDAIPLIVDAEFKDTPG